MDSLSSMAVSSAGFVLATTGTWRVSQRPGALREACDPRGCHGLHPPHVKAEIFDIQDDAVLAEMFPTGSGGPPGGRKHTALLPTQPSCPTASSTSAPPSTASPSPSRVESHTTNMCAQSPRRVSFVGEPAMRIYKHDGSPRCPTKSLFGALPCAHA